MKPISTQQEILLVTGTSFSKNEGVEKDISEKLTSSEKEQLEKACWNGLIKERLPEILEKTSSGKELFLWQVIETVSFIELDLGEYPQAIEKSGSINPYSFLASSSFYN